MRLNKVQMQSSLDFESAAFSEFAFTSCGFTENVFAVVAGDYSLCVTEDDGSFIAASTLDIHEIGVGSWNKPLEFVCLSFCFKGGMEEISVHLW
jgi:hypothetical protein